MSLAKLVLPAQIRRRYDPDAAAYIANVEAADGQSLEQGIKEAITGFVIDCKTAGIWSAIQSCCLLCGARTLSGALVPLKGPAPTNFNSLFTNNDYNRETGLKGNGSSKYLNTNFNATSLPQDNFHFSLYISSLSSVGVQRTYMADTGGRNMYRPISNNTLTQFNINASFGAAQGDLDMASSTGFCGLSRDNASNFTIRIGSRNRVVSASSVGGDGGTMRIFGRNGNNTMGEFSDGRIAFYSVGEQINLKALNDCVDSLLRKILISLRFNSPDSDANTYLSQVELYDNSLLENGVRLAISNFIIGLKNDNLWNSIKSCCILAGARTVDGCLTPLAGNRPRNYNFNMFHYNRILGLIGIFDGVRYLDSLRANNADPQDNNHRAVYASQFSINWYIASANVNGADGIAAFGQATWALQTQSRSAAASWIQAGSNVNGFIGIARNSSGSYQVRGNQSTNTVNSTSLTPSTGNITIFARPGGGPSSNTDARLSFYSIGEYLDLTLLNNRLNTFMTSLSNAGI